MESINRITLGANPEFLLLFFDDGTLDFRGFNEDRSLTPAKPLYQETINNLFAHLNGHFELKTFQKAIPDNVVYANNVSQKIIWKKPAGRFLYYHTQFKKPKTFSHPNLIFVLESNLLYVYAVKKFGLKSKLYMAPFPNMYDENTRVCMGSAEIKIDQFKYWEDVIFNAEQNFFTSSFSHSLSDYDKLGFKVKSFPTKKLKPIEHYVKKKIEDLI